MDKNLVLENIKATQARLVATIKDDPYESPEASLKAYSVAERVKSMDLTPFIDEVAEGLIEAFDWWAKSMKPGGVIGIVNFEYSAAKDDEVYAYGYEEAAIEQRSGDLEGFIDIDYSRNVFYDQAGFKISSFWDKTKGIEETIAGADYETAKMAEILFHAMEKVTLSDTFLKLSKADEVTFTLCSHDRCEIISYVWKKI